MPPASHGRARIVQQLVRHSSTLAGQFFRRAAQLHALEGQDAMPVQEFAILLLVDRQCAQLGDQRLGALLVTPAAVSRATRPVPATSPWPSRPHASDAIRSSASRPRSASTSGTRSAGCIAGRPPGHAVGRSWQCRADRRHRGSPLRSARSGTSCRAGRRSACRATFSWNRRPRANTTMPFRLPASSLSSSLGNLAVPIHPLTRQPAPTHRIESAALRAPEHADRRRSGLVALECPEELNFRQSHLDPPP